jgi:ferredoxin
VSDRAAAGAGDRAASAALWRIGVDPALCIGSAVCVASAPGRFVLDQGRSRPVAEWVPPDEHLLDVAASCPAGAISVHDADGEPLD